MTILTGLGVGALVAVGLFVVFGLWCLISWSNGGCH